MHVWKFNLENEEYTIKLKEIENEELIQIIINKKEYLEKKHSKIIIFYQGHQFHFYKEINDNKFKLKIDTIPFDKFKPKNNAQIENNSTSSRASTNISSINSNIINSHNDEIGTNKLVNNILKQKKDNKRTGSDIYKSDEDNKFDGINNININDNNLLNCFNNINLGKNIPIRRLNSNEINNRFFDNNSINDIDLKRKSSKSNSVYIEEISEGEIPEYDYINEKIINANWV